MFTSWSLYDAVCTNRSAADCLIMFKEKSEESASGFTFTAVPPPSDLSFNGVKADSMRVTWKHPKVHKSSDIERYIIHYHPVDDDDDTVEQIVMGNADFIVLYSTYQQNFSSVVWLVLVSTTKSFFSVF